MQVRSSIIKLRIIAFFLFLVPTTALIGSLGFHNYLVSFTFVNEEIPNFTKNLPGEKVKFECNEQNDFCSNIVFEKVNKLTDCSKYIINKLTVSESGDVLDIDNKVDIDKEAISKELNQKVFKEWIISDQLNPYCILNSKLIRFYNLAPFIFEKTYILKTYKKTSLGTSTSVNPIIYGESSISNIVKRYPVKMIFKPLMFISVILMIAYWYYNNLILNKLLVRQKNSIFYIFGLLSAIFLLLHVIFLGWTFENEIFRKGRRYFIVFFILFEVLAQAYLIKDIYKNKSEIKLFLNNFVVNLKLIFVLLICFSTIVLVIVLSTYNLSDKVDYIVEWNYFLVLLLFYLLSSILWKKQN